MLKPNNIISFALTILLSTFGALIFAQDIHFSQFYLSPLTLNPAQTGNFAGDWRLSSNFRTQWRAIDVPFNTFSAGYERSIGLKTSKVGAGLLVLQDQSGTAKIVSNRILLSSAIHHKVDKNEFHLGIQGGIILKSFDISALTFPDQFDGTSGTFNNDLPNNELNYNQKLNYFDLNVGAGWDYKTTRAKYTVGFALFHLGQPNESFFNTKQKLSVRKVYNLGITWQLGDRFELSPKLFIMSQRAAAEYLVGTNCAYKLGNNKLNAQSLYIGGQTRTGINRTTDALMAIVGLTFERLDLGLSYDFNVSKLSKATNLRGAMEIALIFWSGSKELKPKTISCERF